MKLFYSLFFLFPVLSQAMSISDVQLVRMLNGRAFNCRESYEAGKTAFFPEIESAVADDRAVSILFKVDFSLCVREGEALRWQVRRPLDPVFLKDVDGNPVRLEFRDPDFFFGRADFFQVAVVPASNESSQAVLLTVSLAEILSPSQARELADGKPVKVRMVMVGRVLATSISNRGTTPLGRQLGQSYTLFFTLKK